MKVSKKDSPNGGCNISVEIGGREYSSYWSAPGKSIDHAGLQYITDRYPMIKTEKRAAEFKRQYKNLWIEDKEKNINKILATPKLSKKKKWNIECEKDGELLLLGRMIDNLFMEYTEFDTKQEAIDYINSNERLQLRES